MMKIAILSPFYPFRGGLAQLNERLYTALGNNNDVKAFSFTTLYPSIIFPGKTQFVTEYDKSQEYAERVLSSVNPFSYIRTAKRINKYAPDILIIPYWVPHLAPAFASVCKFLDKKIKVVSLVHNAIPHEKGKLDKILAKLFFKQCDAFISFSQFVADDLATLVSSPKILIKEHPIYDRYAEKIDRDEACKQLGIGSDKKNLLFFGFIRDYKGLDLLIEAMNKLDDSYQLIIAGECYGDINIYKDSIAKSSMKDNITLFDDFIPDDMVTTLFSATDVLVLPYRSATQSGVVAISYQLEVPMIATNVGALGQAVQNSLTGLMVEKADVESIANGIKDFFAGDIHQYAENLKKEKARLSWDTFTQSVQAFLDSL